MEKVVLVDLGSFHQYMRFPVERSCQSVIAASDSDFFSRSNSLIKFR